MWWWRGAGEARETRLRDGWHVRGCAGDARHGAARDGAAVRAWVWRDSDRNAPPTAARFGAAGARCRGLVRCGAGGRGRRQVAGLPEQEELPEPVEQAQEARHDHGVQGFRQPSGASVCRGGGAEIGDAFGQ